MSKMLYISKESFKTAGLSRMEKEHEMLCSVDKLRPRVSMWQTPIWSWEGL